MNYRYCLLVGMCYMMSLQAMEGEVVHPKLEGRLYLEGPIAYGPEKYYKHLNKCNIPVNLYEPLIQVKVALNNHGEFIEWTNNNTIDNKGTFPPIVEQCEKYFYLKKHNTDVVPEEKSYNIVRKFFPSYMPLRLFKEREEETVMEMPVYKYIISLICLRNPRSSHRSFQSFIGEKLNTFIHAPLYFKWTYERYQKEATYVPIAMLMRNKVIEARPVPERVSDLLRMCHGGFNDCLPHCVGLNIYDHGEYGKIVVEKLKEEFKTALKARFFFDGMTLICI